ncbi:unnamed protein product, partial [Staurois parvus]
MCTWLRVQSVLSGDKTGKEKRIKQPFCTMQRINTLGFPSEYKKHTLLHIQTDFTVVDL